MFHAMKPETIARRSVERERETSAQWQSLMMRLTNKAESDPDGIWGDMLDEQIASALSRPTK